MFSIFLGQFNNVMNEGIMSALHQNERENIGWKNDMEKQAKQNFKEKIWNQRNEKYLKTSRANKLMDIAGRRAKEWHGEGNVFVKTYAISVVK